MEGKTLHRFHRGQRTTPLVVSCSFKGGSRARSSGTVTRRRPRRRAARIRARATDGIQGWMAKIDTGNGGMQLDSKFFLEVDKFRPHQVHLEGGDASSDSYCFS